MNQTTREIVKWTIVIALLVFVAWMIINHRAMESSNSSDQSAQIGG